MANFDVLTLDHLEKAVALMRRLGVTVLKYEGTEILLGPPPPAAPAASPSPSPSPSPSGPIPIARQRNPLTPEEEYERMLFASSLGIPPEDEDDGFGLLPESPSEVQ